MGRWGEFISSQNSKTAFHLCLGAPLIAAEGHLDNYARDAFKRTFQSRLRHNACFLGAATKSLVLQPVTFATAFSLASHAARFLASKGLLCKEKQVLLNIQKMWFYEKRLLVCATRTCVTFDRCLSFPGAVCSMLSSCNCYQRNWTWTNASKWPYNDSETRSLS